MNDLSSETPLESSTVSNAHDDEENTASALNLPLTHAEIEFGHRTRQTAAANRALFKSFAQKQTSAGYHIRVKEVEASVPGWGYDAAYAHLAIERKEGRLVKLHGDLDGFAAPEVYGAAPRVTLAHLLERARQRVSTDAEAKAGRKAAHAALNLTTITSSQLEWIERLVDLVDKHFDATLRTPRRSGAESIPGIFFVWTPTGLDGRPGWALHKPVTEWALADHHAAHERRRLEAERRKAKGLSFNEQHLTVWTRDLATETVSKYRAAVNNILNLAATPINEAFPPLIDPSPRITERAQDCDYDPLWIPRILTFERVVRRSFELAGASSIRHTVQSVKMPATHATRLAAAKYHGGLPPASAFHLKGVDWRAVRESLIEGHRLGFIEGQQLGHIRRAWQRVHRRVLALQQAVHRMMEAHHPHVERYPIEREYDWPSRTTPRRQLVSETAIQQAIDVALLRPEEQQFTQWRMENGRVPTALIYGAFGIRAYVTWALTPAYMRPQMDIAGREWAVHPSGRFVSKDHAPETFAPNTLSHRLKTLMALAGWAARHEGVDWQTTGLEALCDHALVARYVSAMLRDSRGGNDKVTTLYQTAEMVGGLANGFIWCQAKHLVAAVDTRLAGSKPLRVQDRERLVRLQAYYQRVGDRTKELYQNLFDYARKAIGRPPSHSESVVREKILKIVRGWRGSDGVHGFEKLQLVIDQLEHEIVASAGGLSIEAQIDEALSGRLRWTPERVRTMQIAVALTLEVRVPLRSDEVVDSRRDMYLNQPVGEQTLMGRQLSLHEGALHGEFPGTILKSSRDFTAPYIRPEQVRTATQAGDEHVEAGTRRHLLQLYDCPGGAREFALQDIDLDSGAARRDERGNIVYRSAWIAPADNPQGTKTLHARLPWMFPHVPAKKTGSRKRMGCTEDGRWLPRDFSSLLRKRLVKYAKPNKGGVRVLDINVPALTKIQGALSWHTVRRLFGSYLVNVLKDPQLAMLLLQHTDLSLTTSRYSEQDTTQKVADARALIAERLQGQEAAVREKSLESQLAEARAAHERQQQQLVSQIAELTAQVKDLTTQIAPPKVPSAQFVGPAPDLVAAFQGIDVAALISAANAFKAMGTATVT